MAPWSPASRSDASPASMGSFDSADLEALDTWLELNDAFERAGGLDSTSAPSSREVLPLTTSRLSPVKERSVRRPARQRRLEQIKVYVMPTGAHAMHPAGLRTAAPGVARWMTVAPVPGEAVGSLKHRLHQLLQLPPTRSLVLYLCEGGSSGRLDEGARLDDYTRPGQPTLTLHARSIEEGHVRTQRIHEALEKHVRFLRARRHEAIKRVVLRKLCTTADRGLAAAQRRMKAWAWLRVRSCCAAFRVWAAAQREVALRACRPGMQLAARAMGIG
ncbi:hypothetical protein AB1Y20_019118 [Prymnesium parvum]|uniref:Ubiquitin-like domain-containing protein n=1 Tax=Prymnesium parvum TaxID=97485 RepID=A0AB34JRH0_PRYPA